jgi:phosphatidylcholine synthase
LRPKSSWRNPNVPNCGLWPQLEFCRPFGRNLCPRLERPELKQAPVRFQGGVGGMKLPFKYRRVPYAEIGRFRFISSRPAVRSWRSLRLWRQPKSRFVDHVVVAGVAMLIDGIDGPIARKLNVKEVLPNWSGVMLDNVIDYVTYVLIPAFALYQSGMIGQPLSFVAAGLIVVSSAIYYADTGMKTEENFFSGFPVVWNMLVFTLFVIKAFGDRCFGIVLVAVVMTFLPINFLHPVRVARLAADQSDGFRDLVGAVGIRACCCISRARTG